MGAGAKRGIDLHCTRRLDPRDVTALKGIPITTVARTLVDLCAVVPPRMIEKALEQSYVLQLIAPGSHRGRTGASPRPEDAMH